MTDEDRKILTEFLGECWHEPDSTIGSVIFYAQDCNFGNRTFDNWTDFGALLDEITKRNLVVSFIEWYPEDWNHWDHQHPIERCHSFLQAIREGVIKCPEK